MWRPRALQPSSRGGNAASGREGGELWPFVQAAFVLGVGVAAHTLAMKGIQWLSDSRRRQLPPTQLSQGRTARGAAARLQRVRLDEYEQQIARDVVDPGDVDVSFEQVGGLADAKREIWELVILPLKHPELFEKRSALFAPPRGILLHGPPGTGKTLIAKAVASESGAAFINCKLSTLMNKWFGEKLVNALFSLAHKLAPTIIFIDEMDAFMSSRDQRENPAMTSMKTEFMTLWDGLLSSEASEGYGVIVMGATNRPEALDPAIQRRMPRVFRIGMPDADARHDILRLTLSGEALAADVSLPALADRTTGYSGSDLKELCRAAAMVALRERGEQLRAAEAQAATPGRLDVSIVADAAEEEAQLRPTQPPLRAMCMADFEVALTQVAPSGDPYAEETAGSAAAAAAASPERLTEAAFAAAVNSLLRGGR